MQNSPERSTRPPSSTLALTWVSGGQFLAFGLAIGVMTVMWAEVIIALDLSEGVFGTVHLLLPVTALVTLLGTKHLYRRYGNRDLAVWGQVAMIAMIVVLAWTGGVLGLLLAFALAGVASALIDTSANSVFMDLENGAGRDVTNVMYAVNSGGTVIGALGCGALLSLGMDYRWVLLVSAAVMLPFLAATFLVRYPVPQDASGAEETDASDLGVRALMANSRLFRVVFALTALGIAVESIVQVWAVIYVDQLMNVPIVVGGAAFALFSFTMLVGRLGNAWLVARAGVRMSFLFSGAGMAIAGAVLMLGAGMWASVLAFTLAGLANAGIQPTGISAASRIAPARTGAIAGAIMMPAYGAFILSPTVYGWLAEWTSLDIAMVLVLVCGALTVALAFDRSISEVDRELRAAARTGGGAGTH
ncbi:MFS family permease [Nocardiopsis arvandica]|uniref:MFS family permease n=1 Tax=Nocardiopsis sinuspersici TaxID=501010 RepID=A0A7Y9X7T9_9ACTN|nr:MFS transporter [Nocardiopsis sinuspersici]NYH50588.1 MFS family permease [Nocardiopsis sinuspersici]